MSKLVFEPTPLALVFLLAAMANGFLSALVFSRKKVPGYGYFALIPVSFGIWALAVFFEFSAIDLDVKIFFSKCSYFGVTTAVVAQFLFSLVFSEKETKQTVIRWHWLYALSAIFIILAFTNDVHFLQWRGYEFNETNYGTFVNYVPGVGVWMLAIFMWGLFFVSMWLISRRLMIGHRLYTQRFWALMAVFLIPLFGNILYMLRFLPLKEIDFSPQLFYVSFGVLYIIMRRNLMLETLPESRDVTFNVIKSPVIVVNKDEIIVDANPEAMQVWPDLSDKLGISLTQVFPDLQSNSSEQDRFEISLTSISGVRWYDVSKSMIRRNEIEQRGWIYVLNDITEIRSTRQLLQETIDKLATSNATKDRFFSIIGHDLRSPFSAILGLSELLILDQCRPKRF